MATVKPTTQETRHTVGVQTAPDIVCFSHLRWSFVYQRPHHLLTRAAREQRVFYVEEPWGEDDDSRLAYRDDPSGVVIVTPHISRKLTKWERNAIHKALLEKLLEDQEINDFIAWYYNPRVYPLTSHLKPRVCVYDCMDELAAFNGAPKDLAASEKLLLQRADVVFTGGYSLYEAKRDSHPNVHSFPSSIEREHFMPARSELEQPLDQVGIPHPRLGYFGVIDERLDYELIDAVAVARPDWQIVLVGPLAKVEQEDLPVRPNIHYLGRKKYEDLPKYLSGWDAALMPFANNKATEFISPTKTPEYLAGGVPVVSTPVKDVVLTYGETGLVSIAGNAEEFVEALQAVLEGGQDRGEWLEQVDAFLSQNSWDQTWADMYALALQSQASDEGEYTLAGSLMPVSSVTMSVDNSSYLSHLNTRANGGSAKTYDYLIVGAGFAGSILAERLARGSGKRVLLIDRRPHIAGNAFDHHDQNGLLVHKYGPHIFHTNSKEVFSYLTQFSAWRPYEHRVRASVDGQLLPLPINLDTINRMYGLQLSTFELEKFFESVAEKVDKIQTSEDVVVSKVGRQIYEKFFRNYTRKQWDLDPSELDASVTSRVPIRMNRDDRYFSDTYQAMPLYGYTEMFGNLLDHPNIHIMLNSDYREVVDHVSFKELIYTGPVDEYFDYVYGKLPYRSLNFRFETYDQEWLQEVAVINYPNEHLYTRCTEFKHLTGQKHPKTSVVYEYPCSEGDPYYPIPRPENAELYQKYRARAEATRGVHFAGRLGTYRYYNMDQVAGQALALYARLMGLSKEKAPTEFAGSPYSVDMPCSALIGQDTDG